MEEGLNKMWSTGSRPKRGLSIVSSDPKTTFGYLKYDEENLSAYLKKRKNCVIKPGHELIENSVVRFLTAARERGMRVTGLILKSQAEQQARNSCIDGFTASEGWLGKVKAIQASQEATLWESWFSE